MAHFLGPSVCRWPKRFLETFQSFLSTIRSCFSINLFPFAFGPAIIPSYHSRTVCNNAFISLYPVRLQASDSFHVILLCLLPRFLWPSSFHISHYCLLVKPDLRARWIFIWVQKILASSSSFLFFEFGKKDRVYRVRIPSPG